MANLAQLQLAPTGAVIYTINANPIVEPLDGPNSIRELLDRFPETLYHTGTDSRLYKFLLALCGDSGAGMLKKLSLQSRLKNEGPLLIWHDLDTYYANIFSFPRLKSEVYNYDPANMALEKQVWDRISEADRSYQRRVIDFFHGTRYGNSPYGMALVAKAGSGQDIDIVENYRWIFDQMSDDILGLSKQGDSTSTSEFVLQPRILGNPNLKSEELGLKISATGGSFVIYYESVPTALIPYNTSASQIEDSITHNGLLLPGDVTVSGNNGDFTIEIVNSQLSAFLFSVQGDSTLLTGGGNVEFEYPVADTFYVARFRGPNMSWYEDHIRDIDNGTFVDNPTNRIGNVTPATTIYLNPDIEHNMVAQLDHVRPTGALMTVKPATERYVQCGVNKVLATTENIHVSRFITGNPQVPWPGIDASKGWFIQNSTQATEQIIQDNMENEATFWSFSHRALPVVFHTIDSALAYKGEAFSDPTYGTSTFYSLTYNTYRSEHYGKFAEVTSLVWFNFLRNIQDDDYFTAAFALASQNTPLIVTIGSTSGNQ
jgi:hypothetical protein